MIIMIDFDYVMSKPLSEQEQKEVEKSFKIKKTKKYEITIFSTCGYGRNDAF